MIDYVKETWYDKSDTSNPRIPINHENLNRIETGVDSCVTHINNLYSHWWRKSKVVAGDIEFSESEGSQWEFGNNGSKPITFYCAKSVSVKVDESTGDVYAELNNPTKVSLSYNSSSGFEYDSNMGKYYTNVFENSYFMVDTTSGSDLYYGTSIAYKDNYPMRLSFSWQRADLHKVYGNIEYVSANNDSAYPNGWSETDVALYEYLGVPFENSRSSCGLITGWYYGNSETNRLINVGRKPKGVLLMYTDYYNSPILRLYGEWSAVITFADEGFVILSPTMFNAPGKRYEYFVFY